MASSRIFRANTIVGCVAVAAVLTTLSLNAARADDIAYFKDVQKPGGHTRSMAAKLADARACGVSSGAITGLMPAFQTCMSGRGWVLDHYGPDPATPRPRDTTVNFTDVKGDARQQPRSNAALQADTRACDAGGKDVEFGELQELHGRPRLAIHLHPARTGAGADPNRADPKQLGLGRSGSVVGPQQ